MNPARRALLVLLLSVGPHAGAQQATRDPHVGCLYPAGGRQGTTVLVTASGQNLGGAKFVHVSGGGVRAKVLETYPPLRRITPEQRQALGEKVRGLLLRRWKDLEKTGQVGPAPPRLLEAERRADAAGTPPASAPAALPQHPLLHDLEHKNIRELLHIRYMLGALRKGQPAPQLAESVLIQVSIERDAALGQRELRLCGQAGLANPVRFEVGAWPETCELEDDDSRLADLLPAPAPLELPAVVNGQIMPGDTDRFAFHGRQGQGLVIETHARRLIPYLADAVPGWFQASLCVRDPAGAEVAFVDDYRFEPDPVLYYEVPADGQYEVEIRDSLFRGRQDFVYRITLAERPFITSLFPLGTQTRHRRYVDIEGWNLPGQQLLLDPGRDMPGVRQRGLGSGKHASNTVTFAVDDLPADPESEPNDDVAGAQRIALGHIADGRIGTPGDIDVFQFKGKAGSQIVAEISARRLNSPLDSVLRLLDAAGNILAWNDDYEHKEGVLYLDSGVQTHSADSYLCATLPTDGMYFVQVTDAQGQGGPACGYRLRVSPPQPDFALRVVPASVNVVAGGAAMLHVYAVRKDGFDGPIDIVLDESPGGFALSGATIPAGRDRIRMTLTAPRKRTDEPVTLELAGRARFGKRTVKRPAVPAEDVTQAFAYRHLLPAQELVVAVRASRLPVADVEFEGRTPVQIEPGGTTNLRFKMPSRLLDRKLEWRLSEPPSGITLDKVTRLKDGLLLVLKADAQSTQIGPSDNLIVEAFAPAQRPRQGGPAAGQAGRTSVGFLPAVPLVVIPSE